MKERFNKFIHSRLFIIVLMGILMCTTLLVGTYAWFTWSSTDNTKLVMTINGLADVIFEGGNNINGNLNPVYDYKKDGLKTNFSVMHRDTNSILSYDIKLNITTIEEELKREDVKWVLEKNGVILSEGDFSSVDNGTTVILANSFSSSYKTSYTFYLYIDGNQENDLSMMNKNITGNLVVEGIEKSAELLTTYIKNLYTSAQPEPIEHLDTEGNKIADYYYSYQDSEQTWGLMNDGLKIADDSSVGATTVDLDAAEYGTEGNIRYFGPGDKVNNYIYFNCSDYSNQTDSTCEKWRIIGIVDGKVKLIRNDSIGMYAWDNKKIVTDTITYYGSNDWSNAALMKLLNPGYEDEAVGGSLYWNSDSGMCYYENQNQTKTCDFTSIGLKNDTTRNMISDSTWYLGGNTTECYPHNIYNYERTNKVGTTIFDGNEFSITAKIGLMYASDYGYGTDLRKCNQHLYNYNSSANSYACRENNWLLINKYLWVIMPRYNRISGVGALDMNGRVGFVYYDPLFYEFDEKYKKVEALPTLYLDENIMINNIGDGSSDSPYQIHLEPIKLTEHIVNLYTSAKPEPIEHKDTEGNKIAEYYYSYQGDKSWGLMNDGLKIDTSLDATTTGLATTVTSTEALISGTEGNIRYFGPSDKVNNYIYFNCSDYNNQTDSTCEKWRIIGIVDGKVKIIRNESIGDLAWDLDKNQNLSQTAFSNNWTTSSLQEFLNGLYYNRGTIESHPYYSGSDGGPTTTLNLKIIGITEATRNNKLISESTWYLGGYGISEMYPNEIYAYERTNKKGLTIYSTNDFTIQKNIGLMYPSDYGYGTDLTKCSQNLWYYHNSADTYVCRANNWLFNSASQWLITPYTSFFDLVWVVDSAGHVDSGHGVPNAYGVRPVLYLDSELTIESDGDGSSINPYRIIVR